jgi:hypothetical protein
LDHRDRSIHATESFQWIVLELKNLTLAGQEVVSFLERCEADGIALLNCSPYVREWITRMRVKS